MSDIRKKIDDIKKQMELCEKGEKEGFSVQLNERCDKCGKQHLGLQISVKLPEIIVLCEHCRGDVDPENNKDWTRPPFIIGED